MIVFGTLDLDSTRRAEALRNAKARIDALAPVDAVVGEWEQGGCRLLTAVTHTARLDQGEENGFRSWVIGEIYDDDARSPATIIIDAVQRNGVLAVNGHNGLYLGFVVDQSGSITVGTDVLGMFPLYYWGDTEAFAFSTVPDLLHAHPRCSERVSTEGLVGILLQGHMANGQTLWERILRPPPGHVVRWLPGKGVELKQAFPLVPTENHFDLKYEDARQLLDSALGDAVRYSVRNRTVGLMLSGGMDSRLLSGHLSQEPKDLVTAFIFGNYDDLEFRCASGVARELKMPVVRLPTQYDQYSDIAESQISQDSLSNTFYDFSWASNANLLSKYGLPLMSGLGGDPAMGGSGLHYAYDEKRGIYCFEQYFLSRAGSWGFSIEDICMLIPQVGIRKLAEQVVEKMSVAYRALPGLPFQQAWLWELYTRIRYHAAPYAWRLSAHAWPMMPYLDRRLLEVAAAIPLKYLDRRRIQIDTLKKTFTTLARLPLDRNSPDTTPLLCSRWASLRQRLNRRFAAVGGNKERLVYYRTFDINNSGWRAIRRVAEQYRSSAEQLFDPGALRGLIPPPEKDIPFTFETGIKDTARHKTAIGLMLFGGKHV